jgi:hypothetical protein
VYVVWYIFTNILEEHVVSFFRIEDKFYSSSVKAKGAGSVEILGKYLPVTAVKITDLPMPV